MATITLGSSDPSTGATAGYLLDAFSFSGWTETPMTGGAKFLKPFNNGGTASLGTLEVAVDANNNVTSVLYRATNLPTGTPQQPAFAITGLSIPLETFRANSANIMPLLTAGDDVISGGVFDNTIYGQAGNDTIIGGGGNDIIYGGAGNDTIIGNSIGYRSSRSQGADQLYGGDGNDTLTPGSNPSSTVAEIVDGGSGVDAISFGAGFNYQLTVDLAAGTATAPLDIRNNGALFATLVSIESVIGSTGDDRIYGNSGANTLEGRAGNDILDGREGNDLLIGGAGADQLTGGAGNDTASYADSAAAVDVNLLLNYTADGDAAGDVLTSIENLTGSAFDDTLIGDANANIIEGGKGADWLNGLGGADTLSYARSGAAVAINLQSSYAAYGDAQGDTLFGFENVTGSAYWDWIFGDAGNNVINGGAGNDVLMGGSGADALIGGAGIDTAIYTWATSAVDVNLWLNAGSLGESAGDTLSGIENLSGSAYYDGLIGNDGNNILDGANGNDWLSATGGSDTLIGGAGNDTLVGGTGQDFFLFESALNAATNSDRILDFSVVDDTVQLENTIFTLLSSTGTLNAALFKDLSLGAQDANDIILYDRATGSISYDSNGLVAGGQTVFADVTDGLALTNADFMVI
jgi:Ca2+-binding RTX toxin-like protein